MRLNAAVGKNVVTKQFIMGRTFHHWGTRVERLCGRDQQKPFIQVAESASQPIAEWLDWRFSMDEELHGTCAQILLNPLNVQEESARL